MTGWKIFTRALSLLVGNIDAALRVSLVPVACLIAVDLLLARLAPGALAPVAVGEAMEAPDPGVVVARILALVAGLGFGSWAAVGWHRYVLAAESPSGWVPPIDGRTIAAYVGLSLLVGFVVVLGVLAVTTMVSVLVLPIIGAAGQVFVLAAGAIAAAILIFRLSLVLPARAIGAPMGLNDSLRATRGQSGTAVVLTLVMAVFLVALQLPPILDAAVGGGGEAAAADAASGPGVVGVVYAAVMQWVGIMLGAGILTALYGHLVEGRPLD